MNKTIHKIRNKIFRKINKYKYKTTTIIPQRIEKSLLSEDFTKNIRVFAATVIREANDKDLTGYLMEIDWLSGKVIKKISIPATTYSQTFWNTRGGNRGGRGISIHNNVLYLATAVTIRKYDRDLNYLGEIANPKLSGIHDILAEDDGIWITSTLHDLIIKVDYEGNTLYEWYGSESKVLQKELDYESRKLNLNLKSPKDSYEESYDQYCREERLHINSICKYNNSIYTYALQKNALIKIDPVNDQVVLQDNNLKSAHNGIFTHDGNIIVNNTKKQTIRIYNSQNKKIIKEIDTQIFKNENSTQFATAGWQRGLHHVTDDIYIVGTSPATLFEVDIKNNIIGKIVTIDEDTKHCIHGLFTTNNF